MIFCTRPASVFLQALTAGSRICVPSTACACSGTGSEWLRLNGSAALDDDPAVRAVMPGLEALYNPDGANTELWYLRNCTAALYNGAEMVKSWRF